MCTKCRTEKSLTDFNWRSRARGTTQSWCKACHGSHAHDYYHNTPGRKASLRRRSKRIRAENRQKVFDFLRANPCVDCGEPDPVVLEFDHVDPKTKRCCVSLLTREDYAWATIQQEIDKCQVRCANCHRRRTAIQFGYYRGLS